MTKNSKDYTKAAEAANAIMDKVVDMLGIKNVDSYHITGDELKSYVEQVAKAGTSITDAVNNISNNIKVDYTNVKTMLKDLMTEYMATLDNTDNSCDQCNCAHCINDNCDDCPDCPNGCEWCHDDDELIDFLVGEEDQVTPYNIIDMHDKEYCSSVYDRLKRERDAEMSDMAEDVQPAITYEEMLADIHVILDDPEDPDYEIEHNAELNKDLVHIKYYIGYDDEKEYNTYLDYASHIAATIKDLYGFPDVYVMHTTYIDDKCSYILLNYYCVL